MDSGLALRAPRNDEVGSYRRAPTFPRRERARVEYEQSTLRNQRAQGMPGVQRTRSLARKQKKRTSKVTAGSPKLSGIPRANGFNGFLRALLGDRALLSPSFASLASASGRQNHTTSPSASGAYVSHAIVSVIWVKREAKFFYPPDWTGQISLSCNEKFDFWRTRFLRKARRKQVCPPIQQYAPP
jgi:hypothetical protein